MLWQEDKKQYARPTRVGFVLDAGSEWLLKQILGNVSSSRLPPPPPFHPSHFPSGPCLCAYIFYSHKLSDDENISLRFYVIDAMVDIPKHRYHSHKSNVCRFIYPEKWTNSAINSHIFNTPIIRVYSPVHCPPSRNHPRIPSIGFIVQCTRLHYFDSNHNP